MRGDIIPGASSPFDDDDDDYMFSSNKKTTTTNLTSTTYSNPFSLSSSVPSAVPPSSTASVTFGCNKDDLGIKIPDVKIDFKDTKSSIDSTFKNAQDAFDKNVSSAVSSIGNAKDDFTAKAADIKADLKDAKSTIENNLSKTANEIDKSVSSALSDIKNETNNQLKDQLEKDYSLKDNQFGLVSSFFDSISKGKKSISILAIENLLNDQLGSRKHLVATKELVKAGLKVIDSDNDNEISLIEFLDFLSLFFSGKHNLKDKIVSVLNGRKSTHKKSGFLNIDEAKGFFEFLKKFFDVKSTNNTVNFDKELSYKDFTDKVFDQLEKNTFVKWQN